MAGYWPNTPEKPARMACNGCSQVRSRTPIWCATIYVPTSWSSWVIPKRFWSLTKRAFANAVKKSAGAATQHCGTTGQLGNCQVGVFLAYAGSKGHTLLDRELYLFVGGEPIFHYFMLRSLLARRS